MKADQTETLKPACEIVDVVDLETSGHRAAIRQRSAVVKRGLTAQREGSTVRLFSAHSTHLTHSHRRQRQGRGQQLGRGRGRGRPLRAFAMTRRLWRASLCVGPRGWPRCSEAVAAVAAEVRPCVRRARRARRASRSRPDDVAFPEARARLSALPPAPGLAHVRRPHARHGDGVSGEEIGIFESKHQTQNIEPRKLIFGGRVCIKEKRGK